MNTLHSLIDEALADLREQMMEDPELDEDVVDEVVDSAVPTYDGDALEVAVNDISLATMYPSYMELPEQATPVDIIRANIREALQDRVSQAFQHDRKVLRKVVGEYEDFEEDLATEAREFVMEEEDYWDELDKPQRNERWMAKLHELEADLIDLSEDEDYMRLLVEKNSNRTSARWESMLDEIVGARRASRRNTGAE